MRKTLYIGCVILLTLALCATLILLVATLLNALRKMLTALPVLCGIAIVLYLIYSLLPSSKIKRPA